ncbi:alternative ribosome-rescue factor A [Pantoea sp. 1.19]|uniref:alternative ribosome-rescue factor A n=1 Tax=Pantoea sp. 1.19 TaxID=1925589 RepID=UPI000948A413|nr:ribosome alternative rescue factor ArfA [Pantoea sp. 1.19]
MSGYQHKKGAIGENVLAALVTDPLFKMRIEVNKKGKGSYRRKDKHTGKVERETSGKQRCLPLVF